MSKEFSVDDFSAIYETHKEMVFRIALGLLANREDAEDVTQETFMQIYKNLDTFRGNAKLSTWIYRITIRVSSKWIAKKKMKSVPVDSHAEQGKTADQTLSLDLLTALKKLPFNSRLVVGLILVQGLSHAEAAEVLNIPEGTVASRLSVAKGRLLSLLK